MIIDQGGLSTVLPLETERFKMESGATPSPLSLSTKPRTERTLELEEIIDTSYI